MILTGLAPDPRRPDYRLVEVDRGRFASLPAESLVGLDLVIGRAIGPWGRRIGDVRFETEGAWKRSGTTVDSLAKELRLALQYPEGAAV